jgi:hypothetical protein
MTEEKPEPPTPTRLERVKRGVRVAYSCLDVAISFGERIACLFLSGIVLVGAWNLVKEDSPREVLHTIEENWKATIICLLPVFARPLRTLLERVEEFWGAKFGKASAEELGHGSPPPPAPPTPSTTATQDTR